MSYVTVPPAYYQAQQPGTPYRAGDHGWWDGPVPGWGENPNSAWAARQAVNGFGAAEAPKEAPAERFTFRGTVPQDTYIRLGVSPWGTFPHGRAYESPQESTCRTCEGWPVSRAIGSIVAASRAMQRGDFTRAANQAVTGLGCGPCQVGPDCATCPNGADLPECSGCVDGQLPAEKPGLLDSKLAGPVIIGVVGALATGIAIFFAKKAHVPVA